MSTGNIIIKPLAGRLTRDTDFLSKMDPYCVLKMGSQNFKTKVASGAGKNPSWSETFTFRKSPNDDLLTIEVWDYDTFSSNDMIGQGALGVSQLEGKTAKWIPLSYKGKSSGEVMLEIEYYPDASSSKKENPNAMGMGMGMYNQNPYGVIPVMQYGLQQAGYQFPPMGYAPPMYPPMQNNYQQPAGAYPPYNQMPPPGYQGFQQGPPPGYQQQGGYQQGSPPGPGYQQGPFAGHQQGPSQGYQQAPPPGYQQGPSAGPGYQQGLANGFQQGPPPGYQQGNQNQFGKYPGFSNQGYDNNYRKY